MAHAIDISIVESVAKIIKKDLIISPATLTKNELERLRFTTITGVTNIESEFIALTYNGAIRPYDITKTYTENDAKEVAMIVERKLKTYLSCRPAALNAQAFKEKEPFPVTDKVDETSIARLPQVEFTLRQAGETYGSEVLQALFHGKRALGDTAYGIYDGAFACIEKDMTTYTDEAGNTIPVLISAEKGNLIQTEAITKPTSTTDFDAFDVYENFLENLDSDLVDNPDGCLVYCDRKRAPYIFQAYMNRYPNLQNQVKFDGTYQFFTHDNVTLIGTKLLGNTDTLIATRPGNFHFGIESERNENNVYITRPGLDPNKWWMWIQTFQGVRLLNPSRTHFAINCNEDGELFTATPYTFGDLQIQSSKNAGGSEGTGVTTGGEDTGD